MFARSNTVHGDPEALSSGMTYVHDKVMPSVGQMEGCVGLSMLVDRASGRCIVTTAWDDEAALQASASGVQAMRERAAEIFRGTVDVAEWEIAVLHRMRETGDGACAHVTWTRGDPMRMDSWIDGFRMAMLAKLEELPGFCSVSMMVDRQSGRGATCVTYESHAAMDAVRDATMAMREEFLGSVGREATEGAEFDVVLAHLRVPETV
jgi:quinol monooxygenase YgiN